MISGFGVRPCLKKHEEQLRKTSNTTLCPLPAHAHHAQACMHMYIHLHRHTHATPHLHTRNSGHIWLYSESRPARGYMRPDFLKKHTYPPPKRKLENFERKEKLSCGWSWGRDATETVGRGMQEDLGRKFRCPVSLGASSKFRLLRARGNLEALAFLAGGMESASSLLLVQLCSDMLRYTPTQICPFLNKEARSVQATQV